MSTPPTNIRCFVHWSEQTVFAGEDIECTITFKNIATSSPPPRTSLYPSLNGFAPGPERKLPSSPLRSPTSMKTRPVLPNRGHRSTLSLNASSALGHAQAISGSWTGDFTKVAASPDKNSHRRSVSIMSIGASESAIDDSANGGESSPRFPRGHGRSASLQIVPRRGGLGGPPSAPLAPQPTNPLSIFNSSPPKENSPVGGTRPLRRPGAITTPSSPNAVKSPRARHRISPSLTNSFKFPATGTAVDESGSGAKANNSDQPLDNNSQLLSPRPKDKASMVSEQLPPVARILSPASMTGTPRSSGEFYSLSNNSTETLASEYLPQQAGRIAINGGHSRTPSYLAPANHHKQPETLMMGYAQVHGSFSLDASLINQSPFEEVKRKGIVGGQGGGVVGVEGSKRDSGFLRGLGWGNIGESLGGLLGNGELSSMKDMRGMANSRSIPLLSTPQSILFVDLRLAPTESRSYKYSFKLPRGLPPSHRGKAIKISYKLVIGTQRPGGAKEQQIRSVEIPFRVLGSVNSHGELLGHDLMAPYVLLRDQARVQVLDKGESPGSLSSLKQTKATKESTLNDFLVYTNELLTKPRQNSSLGLLSPTEAPQSRRFSTMEEASTAKEAIDMAILRSNIATESQQSANRFEIARSGKRVAVVMLVRPSFRLGETVTITIDFTDADIPCYALHAALETSESVDPGFALRSMASILRVTRKTHVSHSESTLFARRVVFSPTIPISATPEFLTSGVSLVWKVRIEFVTPRLGPNINSLKHQNMDLLEEVSRDDRGIVLAAAETIECESFEISVPLRVYGAVVETIEEESTELVV